MLTGAFPGPRQLPVAYALALALFLIVSVAFTVTSWDRTVKKHDEEIEALVVMGSRAVDIYLNTLERLFGELGRRLQKDGLGLDAKSLLQEYQARFDEFEILAVNRIDGENITTSSGFSCHLREQPLFADYSERLTNGERMVVGRPFLCAANGARLTPLIYGLRDASGKLQLLLAGGMSYERTETLWKEATLPPGASMGLLGDDMFVVARYPVPEDSSSKMFPRPGPAVLADYLRSNGHPAAGLVRGRSSVTGIDSTIVFRRLPHYPLTFFVVNPTGNQRAVWWASAWPTYLLIVLLFAGGVCITHWINARHVRWEQERAEHITELEEATLRLHESNAELDAFTHSVSHDLRAPILAIDCYLAVLQRELAPPANANARDLIGKIRANTKHMNELLNDLLDLTRVSKLEINKAAIDVRREVDSVVEELAPEAGRARFEIGELPACRGDRILINEVWSNLISNALKYSSKTAEPVIRIGYEGGAYFVADNGMGFDMAEADKLFKLFSRLPDAQGYAGTGVGLAIVKRIVERHGGRIRAEAEPGKGATFRFTI